MEPLSILVSSTCYDKELLRNLVARRISSLGHSPILSDQGDIFYNPTINTHTACVEAVEKVDLVVLIIGNRFGGSCNSEALDLIQFENENLISAKPEIFRDGNRISITQAEALKAFQEEIPVITIVEEETLQNHRFYKQMDSSPDAIEKLITNKSDQKNAKYVFSFIDYINNRQKNNNVWMWPKGDIEAFEKYLANYLSQLFKISLSEYMDMQGKFDEFLAKNKIIEGNEEYLRLLADLIAESKQEVLFTSTRMASTSDEDEVYRKGQEVIIQESIKFKERNDERVHYGIIESGIDTSCGATELRKSIPDISLRFNKKLTAMHANFFISDQKKVVLRLNLDQSGDKYSMLIENENFAKILKQYFFSIWESSELMKSRLESVIEDEGHANQVLKIAKLKSIAELVKLLEKFDDFDGDSFSIPSSFSDKVIRSKTSLYGGDRSQRAFQLYNDYLENSVEGSHLTMRMIKSIKRQIICNESIDYDLYSDAFFTQYFLANYFKTRHAISGVDHNRPIDDSISVLDVGGGGGSSSLAILDFFESKNFRPGRFDIVDKSDKQMGISKVMLSDRDIKPNYIVKDAYDYLSETKGTYDLIIAANFMCEAFGHHRDKDLSKLLKGSLKPGGRLLVVERLESKIYESMDSSKDLSRIYFTYQNNRFKIPLKNRTFFENIDTLMDSSVSDFVKTDYTVRFGLYE